MQDFVYGEDFCPFIRNPQVRKFGGITPEFFFPISCIAITIENLTRRRRLKNCDVSTYQSNNLGVSRKRFKPPTPGSKSGVCLKSEIHNP